MFDLIYLITKIPNLDDKHSESITFAGLYDFMDLKNGFNFHWNFESIETNCNDSWK